MIVFEIITLICIILSVWNIKSLEISSNGKWIEAKMPIWAWLIFILIMLTPVLNIAAVIVIFIATCVESYQKYPIFRFKSKKLLDKIGKFLNKEY